MADTTKMKLPFPLDRVSDEQGALDASAIDNMPAKLNDNGTGVQEASGTASGKNSHAEGKGTASGVYSHAEGNACTASALGAHAEGGSTEASGMSSHAEGGSTQAPYTAQHAEGLWNVSSVRGTLPNGTNNTTIHAVGIGASEDRKNAEEIMRSGDRFLLNVGGYDGTNASDTNVKDEATVMNDTAKSIAPEYSASSTYAVDARVTYRGKMYKCTTAITTAEAWTASHWSEVDVDSYLTEFAQKTNQFSLNNDIYADLDISDKQGNVLARFSDGHIETKYFDSRLVGADKKTVDLIIFMGQSNMAGRGETNGTWTATAPTIIQGAGYEFRAVSEPTKLYPIAEPFGVNENNSALNDSGKTGSMVTAFVNSYFLKCKVPVIAVSASIGGTSSEQWLPTGTYLPEAVSRFNAAKSYLVSNGYTIAHMYMVWCQGETDGDNNVSAETYKSNFDTIFSTMKTNGVEKCFVVRIGEINVSPYTTYDAIIQEQTDMCKDSDDYILVSTEFASFRALGLMKDNFHYYQEGYNRVGTHAGANSAEYRMYGKAPIMYDSKTDSLYFSKKSYLHG